MKTGIRDVGFGLAPRMSLVLMAGVFFLAGLNMSALGVDATGSPAERLLAEKRALIIAHRGFSAIAPENTVLAFEFALSAGADLVELDYHHSSDGIPVVIHDYELDRTTDSEERWSVPKIRVESRTAEELRLLDAGEWFHPRYKGVRLPLLTEALDVIQKKGVTLIERKAGDASTCVRLLRERDLVNRVVVQAFDWKYLAEVHELEPRQILGALGPPAALDGRKLSDEEKTLSASWVAQAKRAGARVIGWNRLVTKEAVAHAHSQGMKVWVYTINDPKVAAGLLRLGVDGLITDNPALIWRAVATDGN